MKEIASQRDDLANKVAQLELELSKINGELLEKTKEIAQAKRKYSYQIIEKDEKIAKQNKIIEDFVKREENLQLENAKLLTEKDIVLDKVIQENSELAQENKDLPC